MIPQTRPQTPRSKSSTDSSCCCRLSQPTSPDRVARSSDERIFVAPANGVDAGPTPHFLKESMVLILSWLGGNVVVGFVESVKAVLELPSPRLFPSSCEEAWRCDFNDTRLAKKHVPRSVGLSGVSPLSSVGDNGATASLSGLGLAA
jgi:hypothetical protein